MNLGKTIAGALVGAVVAGAFTGFRTYGKTKPKGVELPELCENLEALDPQLMEELQSLQEMFSVPQELYDSCLPNFRDGIKLIEQVCAITMQVHNREIVATLADEQDATARAEMAMRMLRPIQRAFPGVDKCGAARDLIDTIQQQLAGHLQDIHKVVTG